MEDDILHLTAEQAAAYAAVLDAAQQLSDALGEEPDDALEWDDDHVCHGFDIAMLDHIDELRAALRPFIFGQVKRIPTP